MKATLLIVFLFCAFANAQIKLNTLQEKRINQLIARAVGILNNNPSLIAHVQKPVNIDDFIAFGRTLITEDGMGGVSVSHIPVQDLMDFVNTLSDSNVPENTNEIWSTDKPAATALLFKFGILPLEILPTKAKPLDPLSLILQPGVPQVTKPETPPQVQPSQVPETVQLAPVVPSQVPEVQQAPLISQTPEKPQDSAPIGVVENDDSTDFTFAEKGGAHAVADGTNFADHFDYFVADENFQINNAAVADVDEFAAVADVTTVPNDALPQNLPQQPQGTTMSTPSKPSAIPPYGIGLIILAVLVLIALVIVQIQIIMYKKKKQRVQV